ncbi:DUF4199 domain-containing protein [Flexithrix dorotheae]|uniref:DUF4199 domain-containing protein n=1 Tax=Flexithrix dorotheae TaxID=70993 RepID=UPI0003749B26|nr:DUF4199 domain-containing protein [Flexithrix dorotheae]
MKNPIIRKYGLLMAAGFIFYFLFMKLIGLHDVVELRVLNFFIIIGGVGLSIHQSLKRNPDTFGYFEGLRVGVITSAIGVTTFAIFIFFYLAFIDIEFMLWIKENVPLGSFLDPFSIMVTIEVEGMASGFLATFIIMQYEKGHVNTPENHKL